VILRSAMSVIAQSPDSINPRLGTEPSSPRTVKRWVRWWRDDVPQTPRWKKKAPGSFAPPVDLPLMPASALGRFGPSIEMELDGFLDFLGPLTGGDKLQNTFGWEFGTKREPQTQ